MNEKAEFEVKMIKEYARQNGFSNRNTSDLSPFEQWLIIELLRVNKLTVHNVVKSFYCIDSNKEIGKCKYQCDECIDLDNNI